MSTDRSVDLPTDLEARVHQEVEDWVHQHETAWGRTVSTASAVSRLALSPVTGLPPVRKALDIATRRILEQAHIEGQVNHDHLDQLERHQGDPAARLALATGRTEDIRRRRRLVMGAQTATTGAASVTPLTAALSVAGDLVTVTLGLLHTAGGVLAAYGVDGDADLVRLSVGTTLLASERKPGDRRRGLASLVQPATDRSGSVGEVAAGQAGPRLAAEAVESVVRRVAGRHTLAAAPLVGAVIGASSTVWMIDAVVDTASRVGSMKMLGLDVAGAA